MMLRTISTVCLAAVRNCWHRFWPYLTVTVVFAATRLLYHFHFGVRFDHSPIYYFIQYINPWFIEHDFLRSIAYLHQQAPLQNVVTGGCLRIFGAPHAFMLLNALYVALGLLTAYCMIHA